MLLEEVWDTVSRRNGGSRTSSRANSAILVEADMLQWCQQAHVPLDKLEWLRLYITPDAALAVTTQVLYPG